MCYSILTFLLNSVNSLITFPPLVTFLIRHVFYRGDRSLELFFFFYIMHMTEDNKIKLQKKGNVFFRNTFLEISEHYCFNYKGTGGSNSRK